MPSRKTSSIGLSAAPVRATATAIWTWARTTTQAIGYSGLVLLAMMGLTAA